MSRVQGFFALIALLISLLMSGYAMAGVPVVNIEGEGGGGLVPWAYLTNPPAQGKLFGMPMVGATYIFPQNFNVTVYHLNETITDRLEVGFSRTVFNTTNLLGASGGSTNVGVEELTMDTGQQNMGTLPVLFLPLLFWPTALLWKKISLQYPLQLLYKPFTAKRSAS